MPMNAMNKNDTDEPPSVDLTIIRQDDSTLPCPSDDQLSSWVTLALGDITGEIEVAIVLMSAESIQSYNEQYRHVDKPTNVLSFPADDDTILGDILMCPSIINQEAIEEDKTNDAHWAHITIHGVLHLLGFDHVCDDMATIMEAKEISLLNELGYKNPYAETEAGAN